MTELATERGVTNGHILSVRPSVIISPTEFIPITDGISPSVKLFNGVVEIFAGLKTVGSLQYRGGAAECFFFNN